MGRGRGDQYERGWLLSGGRQRELDTLERCIAQYRAPLTTGLLTLQLEWYEGAVRVDALRTMRFFNMPEWTAKAPSRLFGDLVGVRTLDGNAPEFRGFTTSIERPIAVGPSLDGPLCLVEGYTRCGAIVRDHGAGLSTIEQVPMIVGITPRIKEWSNGAGWRWW